MKKTILIPTHPMGEPGLQAQRTPYCTALLDRLFNQYHIIATGNDSYLFRHSNSQMTVTSSDTLILNSRKTELEKEGEIRP